jgi:hypothetical protein
MPLRALAARLPDASWPDREHLNVLARSQPLAVNVWGAPITFCPPAAQQRSAVGYEQRIAREGAVEHREGNWHDLLNALVWMTFPRTKSAVNCRHVEEIERQPDARRSRARDALTQLDEDGLIVVSESAELLDLLRGFRWRELFWDRRAQVVAHVRWFVVGHAQYEKLLQPYVGITAKALTFEVEPGFCERAYAEQVEQADALAAARILQPASLPSAAALAPVPVLGIPGWFGAAMHAAFYDDRAYFRPGRRLQPA